ncbi:SIR2 family protein [Sphingomonas sp. DG1-23]|uniref:SIR2 family protein n=1 Tax=Sphingomonas sp. DG1-23 TaxID=3068316 RepID=UPI00273FE9F0|nr:SIR2 family protein [Sphingomonas sp. DG1-23]MDP5278549.1 SIR2 family protein [Sphingomonas sp. DG1-23]
MGFDLIRQAAESGDLVIIAGAGVSIGLTNATKPAPPWRQLISNCLEYAHARGEISDQQLSRWRQTLDSDDIDDLISTAEFAGRKLGSPDGILYARWLQESFESLRSSDNELSKAIKSLHNSGVQICTTNYDNLIEQATDTSSITCKDRSEALSWFRKNNKSILHLHGVWNRPPSCILGVRDYEVAIQEGFRRILQQGLASFKTLLFVGCGDTISDPNFSALVRWAKEVLHASGQTHYALTRDIEVTARLRDPTWHGFIEPISFGAAFDQLGAFLQSLAPSAQIRQAPAAASAKSHDSILKHYREFLLKDCGQMSIEGIKTDFDTAQGKFHLERLFVPLEVARIPPDFPQSDPDREEKLAQWLRKHGNSRSFGSILRDERHIALLALPGGGKTLLLKRLAVAYADPTRRTDSNDALPKLDVIPLMIRCREWREHIRKPLETILKNMDIVTGKSDFSQLYDAILPHLRTGNVLVLIDGLDEIHDDGDRQTFVENLEKFVDEFPNIRTITTSREAGFSLVAPNISRFCSRWRIEPLSEGSIRLLVEYWQLLMGGEDPDSAREAKDIWETLRDSAPLSRLAENPLLLTMLLVVKNSAGRLPVNRVNLYERAVEVLLDTWNIKGHKSLDIKESIPQLSCVAFEMLVQGKQTATKKEILSILDSARDNVSQIKRYAKDTPAEFLKRVEIRSSLLVEAGHSLEDGRIVPFYQFRHLTFQEYLAAVAAAEGNFLEYKQGDSVLIPLAPFLSSERWKEVIPMAAVLSRKQAEPLVAALVDIGSNLLATAQDESGDLTMDSETLPDSIGKIFQCLFEEAECSSETLVSALQLIALSARGAHGAENWRAFVRGPYGAELLHQSWLTFDSQGGINKYVLRNTLSNFAALRKDVESWLDEANVSQIRLDLHSNSEELITIAASTICGIYSSETADEAIDVTERLWHDLQIAALSKNPATCEVISWVFALYGYWSNHEGGRRTTQVSVAVLDRMLHGWLVRSSRGELKSILSFAIFESAPLDRASWQPMITLDQLSKLGELADNNDEPEFDRYDTAAFLWLSYLTRHLPDAHIRSRLDQISSVDEVRIAEMLAVLCNASEKEV